MSDQAIEKLRDGLLHV
jgi:hypothetical protein